MKTKRRVKMVLVGLLVLVAVLLFSVVLFFSFAPQLGARAEGLRLERMQRSPNWKEGRFRNPVPTVMNIPGKNMLKILYDVLWSDNNRVPGHTLPNRPIDTAQYTADDGDSVKITWLGHSTLLIRIGGKTLITDPVFSERASMVPFMGPKRFDYETHYTLDDLPPVDAAIISHDHYDHLDYNTIRRWHPQVGAFFVPLGVGAHLERWGVATDKIVELDWWEEVPFHNLRLICTPTRHFSGRQLTDRFKTLWSSWVIIFGNRRIFYGSDSGYYPGFRDIGERYGPFDITMLECGAYGENWPYIHMMPEQAARAHLDLQGRILLPIHWAKFNLSLHPWNEPITRLLREAERYGIDVATPMIGECFTPDKPVPHNTWWK